MNPLATSFVFLLIFQASKETVIAQDAKPWSCGCELDQLDTSNYWLDIIYIIDSSSNVIPEDFNAMKEFVSMNRYMNIDQAAGNPKYTRVGIVNTAEKAVIVANLTTIKNGNELLDVVLNGLPHIGGHFKPEAGLKAASNMIEQEGAAHRRDNVRKVVVMFSSVKINCFRNQAKHAGLSDKNSVLCQLAAILQVQGVVLITVGLKYPGLTFFPNIDLADSCYRLNNTEEMTQDLMMAFCRANCYCPEPYTQLTIDTDGCDKYAECLFVHNKPETIENAKKACKKENSILTLVKNKEKQEFVKDLHLSSGFFPFWLGMECYDSQCIYDDGTQMKSTDYVNWCSYKSQPNYSKGLCAIEDKCQGFDTAWFNEECGDVLPAPAPTHYYSCQKEACTVNNYCEDIHAA